MNLLAEIDAENYKYINVLDALNLLANKTKNNIPELAKFLLFKKFDYVAQLHFKNHFDEIMPIDDNDTYLENWTLTCLFLNRGLDDFECTETDYNRMYKIEDYDKNFWLCSDFFNFEPIKKLNLAEGKEWINQTATHDSQTDYNTVKGTDKPQIIESSQHIKALSLSDLYTPIEAACFISNDDPTEVTVIIECLDFNYPWNYKTHLQAVKTIERAITTNNLLLKNGLITRRSLQRFLFDRGFVIVGFNDNLPPEPIDKFGNPSVGHPDQAYYIRERDQYMQQCEQKNVEIELLKVQIAHLAEQPQKIISQQPSVLDLILDTNHEKHAPDLAHAIHLWNSLYHINLKEGDSHSNMATIWINQNTGYLSDSKGGTQSIGRLKEISTPFNDWPANRNQNHKKPSIINY